MKFFCGGSRKPQDHGYLGGIVLEAQFLKVQLHAYAEMIVTGKRLHNGQMRSLTLSYLTERQPLQ